MSAPAQPLLQRLQAYWFGQKQPPLRVYEWIFLWLAQGLYRLLLWARERIWVTLRPARPVPFLQTLAVGNLVVGGAGKTPTVMALAGALSERGICTGILSRGYKSQAEQAAPRVLTPSDLVDTPAQEVGDEAWLLCWRTQVPVAVGKDRYRSLLALKQRFPELQVAILDDGLAQRRLQADQRLLVLDSRGFGNGYCLPLGPLREPAVNLRRFDAWVDNGFSKSSQDVGPLPRQRIALSQQNGPWVSVDQWQSPEQWLDFAAGIKRFRSGKILAVAGIAVPERFFEGLRSQGLQFETLVLDDHDPLLTEKTLRRCEGQSYDAILMTEKDAVKFFHHDHLLRRNMWALRIQTQIDSTAIERLMHGPKTS